MYSVLLDTNILLDYHLGRGAFAAECAELIARLMDGGSNIMVAASSVKDEFYLVAKTLKQGALKASGKVTPADAKAANEVAWACVRQTMEVAQVIDVGFGDCLRATTLRPLHPDFEDNLVAAAGERSKVDYLVTNDKRLLRHAALRCLTSREMLDLLNSEAGGAAVQANAD